MFDRLISFCLLFLLLLFSSISFLLYSPRVQFTFLKDFQTSDSVLPRVWNTELQFSLISWTWKIQLISLIYYRFQGWCVHLFDLNKDVPYWKCSLVWECQVSTAECCQESQAGGAGGCHSLEPAWDRAWRLKIPWSQCQTEMPAMAEDGCLTWRDSGAVQILNGRGTHPFLQRCLTTVCTWAIRSLMHLLHGNRGRCWHRKCQNYSGSKINLLWSQAVFLHEQNILFLETTLYDMNDRYAFSLKETKCTVSIFTLSCKLTVIFSWWKQKGIILKWWGSGHFGTVEWTAVAITNCFTLVLAGKAFIKIFTKPKDIIVNSNLGPGSERILGQEGDICAKPAQVTRFSLYPFVYHLFFFFISLSFH